MNIERFHNQLALILGYDRIVNNKRITIMVEDSNDPWVTLKVQGYDDIRFKASDNIDERVYDILPQIDELNLFIDAVHKAYVQASKESFGLPYLVK